MIRARSRRTRIFALTAVLALGVTTAATSTAWGAARDPGGRYQPGAPGVGDPYFPLYGNGGYDTRAYDLDVRYDPETDHLDGVAAIKARATDDIDQFDLDLVGLTVRSITIDGRPVKRWHRTEHELVITPRKKLKDGERFTTVVRYDGVPLSYTIPSLGIPSGWLHSDDGAVVAGEPEVAARWYPVNDHPQDKARYRVDVTVPEGLEALSNGRLRGHHTADGWTTWRWAEREPMASYLVTATIGQFDITRYTTDSGIPVVDAVDPDLGGSADNALAAEPEVIDFLSSQFGPYPFHDLGGIVDDYPQLYFALENQTRPVYSRYFFQPGDHPAEVYVIAHELAHQWYGDSVSVHFWRDIWLNEGFAAYAEWLWSDHTGDDSPQQIFDFYYADHPEGDDFWDNTTYDPGEENLFDDNSTYTRGAMTLQALRMTVGDAAFFDILRTWHRRRGGDDGSTKQFTRLAERLTGRNLDDLFREWLYEEGKPPYPGGQAAARSALRTARDAGVPEQVRSLRERVASGQRF